MDLRLPIGALFSIFGAILALFGAASDRAIYQKSLGVNVNLDWGLVMLAFGLIFVALALAAAKAGKARP